MIYGKVKNDSPLTCPFTLLVIFFNQHPAQNFADNSLWYLLYELHVLWRLVIGHVLFTPPKYLFLGDCSLPLFLKQPLFCYSVAVG